MSHLQRTAGPAIVARGGETVVTKASQLGRARLVIVAAALAVHAGLVTGCGGGGGGGSAPRTSAPAPPSPPPPPPPPGPSLRLTFVTQPTTTAPGASMAPPPQVAVVDANGKLVTAPAVTVSLALQDPRGATLGALPTVTQQGVAAFPGLTIDHVGSGHALVASAPGAASATSRPFDVVPDVQFAGAEVITDGAPAYGVAAADLDGDGVRDIVTGLSSGDGRVLWGLGSGRFEDGTPLPAPCGLPVGPIGEIAITDVDEDGRPDVVLPLDYADHVVVYRSLGGRAFSAGPPLPTGDGPCCAAVGDLEPDGDVDLVILNAYDATLTILLGDGNGSFAAAAAVALPGAASQVALADLDGDGHLDAVTTRGGATWVLQGDGTGGFALAATLNAAVSYPVALVDFDRDGLVDILGQSSTRYQGAWLENLGGFSFAAAAYLAAIPEVASDLDHDGNLDVGGADGEQAIVQFGVQGPGYPTLRIVTLGGGAGPYSLRTGDLDGDGVDDLVASTGDVSGAGRVMVHRAVSASLAPGPVVSSAAASRVGRVDADGDGLSEVVWLGTNRIDVQSVTPAGFTVRTTLPVGGAAAVASADLDGDGREDLAVAHDRSFSVYLNTGGSFVFKAGWSFSTFVPPSTLVPAPLALGVAAGDLDGDGDKDLLLVDAAGLRVGLNDGSGAFSGFAQYPQPADTGGASLADVDQDGVLDAIVTVLSLLPRNDWIEVRLGDGAGGFGGSVALSPLDCGVGPPAVGDVDDDGLPDVVTVDTVTRRVVWYRGLGGGSFSSGRDGPPLGPLPTSPRLVDLNADGALDLVVPSSGSRYVSVFVRSGPGTWRSDRRLSTRSVSDAAAFDVDGDGKPDVVTAGNRGVAAFLQR